MKRKPLFSGVSNVRPYRFKRGLSIIQLVGCVAAIVAGVAVGATFMEVDLKDAWQLGLARIGVGAPKDGTSPADSSNPTANPDPDTESTATAQQEGSGSGSPASPMAEATEAYWSHLREIIHEEQAARTRDEEKASGAPRAVHYARLNAFRGAAHAIGNLKTEGVDPEAVALASDLETWYERAADLSEEGTLLDESDLATGTGPQGRRWHSAQKQQKEQLDLLTRKTTSLQGKLSARYRTTFPDLR